MLKEKCEVYKTETKEKEMVQIEIPIKGEKKK